MLRSLISASVRFRFLVIAVAAGVMALAVATVPGIHADVLPETAPVTARIQTEAPGLSAPEVESLVTVPLEKNLLEGVMGVTDVTSDSVPGLSQINLDFAPGTSLYQARQLVQERLTQAFVLPNVSRPPVLLQPVSSTGNVMLIGLTSRRLSQIDLSVLARWTIVPRLLGVSGVADVAAFGEADRQLQVLVDPARLAARHITLAQIIETAGNAQLVSPLSYLEGSTPGTGGFLEGPNQRITIEPVLPFGTPANLGQVPVTETTGPKPVPLGSVTDIVVGHQPLIGDALVRGQPGLVLVVQKLPSASVPAVTDGLNQAMAQLAPSLSGVRVDTTLFRPASYIDSALHNLSRALIAAAVLAALALIALLLNLRLAVVALTATAISLTAGTVLLYLLGYTFNALVTLGLLLVLAVVAAEAAGTAQRLAVLARGDDSAAPRGDSIPPDPPGKPAPWPVRDPPWPVRDPPWPVRDPPWPVRGQPGRRGVRRAARAAVRRGAGGAGGGRPGGPHPGADRHLPAADGAGVHALRGGLDGGRADRHARPGRRGARRRRRPPARAA